MTNSMKKLSPKSLKIYNLVNIFLAPYVWMTESQCYIAEVKYNIVNQLNVNKKF